MAPRKGLAVNELRHVRDGAIRGNRVRRSPVRLFPRIVIILTAAVFSFLSQATAAPVRLAIVSEDPELAKVADVLTVEFSRRNDVILLERDQIEKVYREQTLAAGRIDNLKLGQVLGADGLLLLNFSSEAGRKFLKARLIAVKPGIVIADQSFPWPIQNVSAWAAGLVNHLRSLTPKLAIPASDAIPISILNLRSAIELGESREAERQLTLLVIERLSREPRLFVLERQRMQLLTAEKELKGLDESAFWDGSYLLDGTLDNKGYSKDTITISARLSPPKGGSPSLIEVSARRTNYTEAVNQVADKVLASLKIGRSGTPWNAAEEAEQFYTEALWALKWNLYPQAQAAAESAWALGKKNSESAGVLFDAYSRSVPAPWLNASQLNVQAFPDAKEFAPLARALGILSQNTSEFFSSSNSSSLERFQLGFDALWRAAGLLESYYYAAEARLGHEEQLTDLRDKMRRALKAMDAHPIPATDQSYYAQEIRKKFEHLNWDEGGVCFEHPEEALPFYRELMNHHPHLEDPPRVIGWTWPDRQRAPRLQREFVKEACTSTNPVTRLEGFYLALLLAPDDEQGSLGKAEQDLISAMWENREVLFSSAENVSLVKRTDGALRSRYDEDDRDKSYNHEPFLSFKHRLRMDFLEHSTTTNLEIYSGLFWWSGHSNETEQARELLPLMIRYQQKMPSPGALQSQIADLRRAGGFPATNSTAISPAARPAEDVVEAKFIRWNLLRPGIEPDCRPEFFGMMLRGGQMWLKVLYTSANGSGRPHYQTTYLAVDAESGVKEEIPFPDKLGVPSHLFEVTSNALFVEAGGHLYRFKLREKIWDEISAPLEGSTRLIWLNDRLLISRSDGLLSVQPNTKSVQLLVSTRRQPAVNAIDPLWDPGTLIYPQPDGRLGALTETHCFTFDPANEQWKMRAMPFGTNRYPSLFAEFSSEAGSQRLLTGPVSHHYLVGFWNGDQPCESLLMEDVPFTSPFPVDEEVLKSVRWDWPREFSLEPSSIHAADKKLWILCPRKVSEIYHYVLKKPVQFSDDRDATVFYFEPEFRQALSMPVKFQRNGANMDPLDPPLRYSFRVSQRWATHLGNFDAWMKTPSGLVFATTFIGGHWLVPNATLEPIFETQRRELRRASAAPSAKQAIPP